MRAIPAALQVKLDAGITTLAQCWIVRRRDGVVQGFTDHDSDLAVTGVLCRAGTGLAASEAAQRFDLSVDGAEISGALSDATLSEADLAAGRYDAATVESYLVDWSDPALTLLTARSTLGEVRREGQAFTAELRGLADLLSQESGRLYTAHCGADLGDARCGVNLGNPAWRGSGVVAATLSPALIAVSGLSGFAEGVFTAGRLTWTSGANAGSGIEIKQHRVAAGGPRLTLWQAMAEPIAVGDAFAITAGCDKQFSTCRDRFGNALNFRGFPQIPGNDFVISYPVPGHGDGGVKRGGGFGA
uniref:Bacteriophage phiJL001 Gp84 C-terminal domain-containing protein n=1 Tax=Rhodopseudomonas palustris (strain BisA53) TaxID=316055 RepID=Q07QB8_RHOP5